MNMDINQPFVTQEQKFKYWEESKAEIQTLRAKVEMLGEALEFYANQDNYYVENDSGFIYPSVVKAQKALATYDKLKEVKHDTK